MNARLKEIDEDEFEQQITELYGTFKMGYLEFDAGRIMRELDPTAFRVAMSDEPDIWVCDTCDAEYSSEEEAEECCKDEDETN